MLRLFTLFLILLLPVVAFADIDQTGWNALDAQEKTDLKKWIDSGAVEFAPNHNIVYVQTIFWNKLKYPQKENVARICNKYCLNRVGGKKTKFTLFYNRYLNNRIAIYSLKSGFKAK